MQTQTDWRVIARQKFPYGRITGNGAFAVVVKGKPWQVFLYKTQARAEKALAERRGDFTLELESVSRYKVPACLPDDLRSSGIDWGRD
jgi:hypothetical protein